MSEYPGFDTTSSWETKDSWWGNGRFVVDATTKEDLGAVQQWDAGESTPNHYWQASQWYEDDAVTGVLGGGTVAVPLSGNHATEHEAAQTVWDSTRPNSYRSDQW